MLNFNNLKNKPRKFQKHRQSYNDTLLNFKILRGKKITVIGLGLLGGGVGTVKWLVKQGADVLVTDLKTKRQLKNSLDQLRSLKIKYILGKHRQQDFVNTDLIVKNPGVARDSKFLKIAKKNKIPIESDLSIFFRLFKGKIIGVTGTKGKSTTVSLLAHILKTAKKKFILGGNIGQSPLNYLNKNYPLALLEISSWQLEDMAHLKKSPQIACLTTIFPDHLNTYKNFNDYLRAKKIIFKWQTKKDILILNADDLIVRRFNKESKAKVIFFSQKNNLSSNVSAASVIARVLNVSRPVIKKALNTYKGLSSRLELIREKNGIKYYNDSASTVPQSTILALNSLRQGRNIVLISGGADKKLDFGKMVQEISKSCQAVILLPGSATAKIKSEILVLKCNIPIFFVQTMKQAVQKAKTFAQRGDIVLLSPGCASFGIFQNAYDRAARFVAIVKKL